MVSWVIHGLDGRTSDRVTEATDGQPSPERGYYLSRGTEHIPNLSHLIDKTLCVIFFRRAASIGKRRETRETRTENSKRGGTPKGGLRGYLSSWKVDKNVARTKYFVCLKKVPGIVSIVVHAQYPILTER